MLKVIIIILLIAIILSLASGAVFFFKDQGGSKRTLYALGIRITLAILLIICLVYGVLSGQFRLGAPWDDPVAKIKGVQYDLDIAHPSFLLSPPYLRPVPSSVRQNT